MIHQKTFRILIIFIIAITLCSCARRPTTDPLPFDVAVKALTNHLLKQVEQKSLLKLQLEKTVVMDDFTDEDTGEFVAASQAIEKMILDEAKQNFNRISISKMNKNNIHDANFLLNGVISLEKFDANSDGKNYHLLASVTDLKTGEVIANSAVWISDKNLDYAPQREYKAAPMFMNDTRNKSKVKTARSEPGNQADMEYYKSLETSALLQEAASTLEKENYPLVINMLKEVATRADGQSMNTYSMLYQAYFQQGEIEAAEEAFGKLVDISIKNNSLSVRLLFGVNSTEFIADKDLRTRYQLWIRQLSKYFNNQAQCVKIIGHSSHTGSEAYNDKLSAARAVAVQRHMVSNFKAIKAKSATLGMGFKNNIKGLGTDDSKDAVDRRVEFLVTECANLS
ncbi:MAG: OmpA family protein [Methylococcaceae bacterium]|nr:OmpA family protein [Methylococcaceae bacterium]